MSKAILESLIERRNQAWKQAQDILARADVDTNGTAFTGDDEAAWQKANDDLDRLDGEIRSVDTAMKRTAEHDKVASTLERDDTRQVNGAPSDQRTADRAKLDRMVRGEAKFAEFGRDDAERRDLTKGVTTAGGFTVPTGFYAQLVEHMIENSAIRDSNVTVVTTDGGEDLQVPKTTTHPTAGIIAEGGAITESDAVFGQTTLGAFKYGFMTQLSAELETDTGVDLVGYLARIGGEALGNGSGAHFVTGTGSGQPNGVVTASTLGVTGGAGVAGVFTADNLIDLFYSVIAPYRRRGTWMMSDVAIRNARKLKDANDQYLWQPSLTAGDPDILLGRPVLSDTNVADPALSAKSVIFGDLSKYFIRDVRGVRVERSVDFAFGTDLVSYRFLLRTDGDLIDLTGAVKHFIGNAA